MAMSLLTLILMANPVPGDTVSPADAAVIQKLIEGLKDADPDVRQNLAASLAKVGTASIDPLTAALKDANRERRAGAAYALSLHGEAAKTAIPTLLEMIADESLDVRRQATYALSKIIPTPTRGSR